MTEDEERERKIMDRARDLGLTFRVVSRRSCELRVETGLVTHGSIDEIEAFLSGADWEREAEGKDKVIEKLDAAWRERDHYETELKRLAALKCDLVDTLRGPCGYCAICNISYEARETLETKP